MDARRTMRRFAAAAMSCATLMLGLAGAGEARAGCGTLWTINTTDHVAWITVYDLGHLIHMDYGPLLPHSVRSWTGGAGVLPYACGSFYHVRAEVFADTSANTHTNQKIFDTEVQVNPQLSNWANLVASFVKSGLMCVMGEEAVCAVKWGVTQGAELAALGAESTGSVSCLKTLDNVHFWWDNNDKCAEKPKPTPIRLRPDGRTVVPGGSNRPNSPYKFSPYRGDTELSPAEIKKGKWSTTNPKVAVMFDDMGHFDAKGVGDAKIQWTYQGVTYSSEVHVRKP
jgi:hypothetical protein